MAPSLTDEQLHALILEHLPEADALLIVPAFAHLTWPSLGVASLQAVAAARGHRVAVLYANLLFARLIEPITYGAICNAPMHWFLGERCYALAAHGDDRLAADLPFWDQVREHQADVEETNQEYLDHLSGAAGVVRLAKPAFDEEALREVGTEAVRLSDAIAACIVERGYPIVGASTLFEQTNASLAVLSRVKRLAPETITLIGGPNCDGEMAEGMASIAKTVDIIVAGEADERFPELLDELKAGRRPAETIVRCEPVNDLESLPCVDHSDWYTQLAAVLPGFDAPLWLSYESSRGCWWGAKKHCTFCGLNNLGMSFRQKSPDKVIRELRQLTTTSGIHRVQITDNIMPWSYHRTVVPRLAVEVPGLHIFYEQKSNLTLDQVEGLARAGIRVIQPGIESLSTPLLARMRKGVLARQNLDLLRFARATGVSIQWNMLYGFPQDTAEDYTEMVGFLHLLRHLSPPLAAGHVTLERFSPYHDDATAFEVTGIRANPGYYGVFPEYADVERLAYHFAGEFPCWSLDEPEPILEMKRQLAAWMAAWGDETKPALAIQQVGDSYLLIDTRYEPQSYYLAKNQAMAALVGGPWDRVRAAEWAVAAGVALRLDGWCVPLATATPSLMRALAAERDAPATLQTLSLG